MTSIAEDEQFKGSVHGLLLGCVLPVFAFNVMQRKALNVCLYGGVILFEVWQIVGHVQASRGQS